MTSKEPVPVPGEDLSAALALVNTRVSGTRGVFDRLGDGAAVHQWLLSRRLIKGKTVSEDDVSAVMQLRDDARSVFAALEDRRAPEKAVLKRVNAAAEQPVSPVLAGTGDQLILRWQPVAAEGPAAYLARDLATFAVSREASQLRTCAADDCDRMFVQDHGRRIWCSPGCGNRMRVQRHAAKRRAATK